MPAADVQLNRAERVGVEDRSRVTERGCCRGDGVGDPDDVVGFIWEERPLR